MHMSTSFPVALVLFLLATASATAQTGFSKTFESFIFSMESTITITEDSETTKIRVELNDIKLTYDKEQDAYFGQGDLEHKEFMLPLGPDCSMVQPIFRSDVFHIRVEVDEYHDAAPDVRLYIRGNGSNQSTMAAEGAILECTTQNGTQRITMPPQPLWLGSWFIIRDNLGEQPVQPKGWEIKNVKVEGWQITGLEEENFRVYKNLDHRFVENDAEIREVAKYEFEPCLEYKTDFEMGVDSYTFANAGENLWPQSYWSQINYSLEDDVFKRLAGDPQPQRFPDWYTFVRAFGEQQTYRSTFPQVYNPTALIRWRQWSGDGQWGGSCYGFAYSSLLHYCGYRNTLQRPLGMLSPDGATREDINAKYLYQFSREGVLADAQNSGSTPKQTVEKLIELFKEDGKKNPGLAIVTSAWGHEIVPLKVQRCFKEDSDDIITKIISWDNNDPANLLEFTVNETQNTVTAYGSTMNRGVYPDAPADVFISPFPGLQKSPGHLAPNLSAGGWTEVYHSGSGSAALSIPGYPSADLNAVNTDTDMTMFPMHGKTGTVPVVPGYYVADEQAAVMSVATTSAGGNDYVCSIDDGGVLDVHFTAQQGSTVQTHFQPMKGSLQLTSDAAVEELTLNLIQSGVDEDLMVRITEMTFSGADSLTAEVGTAGAAVVMSNPGQEKTYNFELMKFADSFSRSGMFADLTLTPGSTHRVVVGSYDSLATTQILVEIDTDGNGKANDIRVLRGYNTTSVDRPAVLSEDLRAWPAPWNPALQPLQVRYSLRQAATARLVVYNTLQQQVAELVPSSDHHAGTTYHASWNGTDMSGAYVPSGTYFYVLEAATGARAIGKVAVIR